MSGSGGGSSADSKAAYGSAERVFSLAMLVSGFRCFLAYVLLPWALPAMSTVGRVGSGLGLAVGVVAVVFNVLSIRRFWRGGHRYRWVIVVVNSGVITFLAVMTAIDVSRLV